MKTVLLPIMAAFYLFAGVSHFTDPEFFLQIVPPFIPWHAACVAVSGAAEIVLGGLVLVPATRRLAAWGLIALLIAVYPANLYQAVAQVPMVHRPTWMPEPTPVGLWLRLPVQFVLIAWAWWYTRPADALRQSLQHIP